MYKKTLLVLLTIFIFISSIALDNKAFAAEPSVTPTEPEGIAAEANKRIAVNIIGTCLRLEKEDPNGSGHNYHTRGADIGSTQFPNSEGYNVASVSAITGIEKVKDKIECQKIQNSFISFMNTLGFSGTTPREIYCNIQKESSILRAETSQGACPAATATGMIEVYTDKLKDAIDKKYKQDIGGYIAYYIGYKMLIQECAVDDQGVYIKDGGQEGEVIAIVKDDGSVEEHVYKLGNADSEISMWNLADKNSWGSGSDKTIFKVTCKDMVSKYMSKSGQWAKDFISHVENLPKTPKNPTTEDECDTKYAGKPNSIAACKEGRKHPGDNIFCDSYFGEEREACRTGAGISSAAIATEKSTTGDDNEEDQENCKIDWIGWIICPVVNTLASMSEGARAKLVDMLTIDTKSIIQDTSDGSVYSYWSKIRDYANILFVIFFMFVIYSQITGYGLDNYGIKRMLPKLIIGVIVVNTSFYICGLLVDLSNVIGSSAFKFISTTAIGNIPAGDWNDSDQGWISKIAAGALVITAGYFALAAVISMLLFVVITAVTTIFLLGVREAIIIMCIVLSPLAFAAMIMPNTEGLYKKWWGAFKSALIVYPMVGIVYGASNLAAKILGSNTEDFIMQVIVALLVFAPLLIVPKLVRSAVEIIGIGGAIAWANKKMNKGRDRLTDKVGKWRENKLTSQFGKHRREKAQLRNAQIRGGTYRGRGGIANFRNWRSAANRRLNAKSGDFGQKRKLVGSMALLEEDKERMKMANAWIADNNMSSDRLAEIATGVDKDGNKVDLKGISSYQRRAAMQALAPHMTGKQAADLATASASFGDASLRKEAADAIGQSGAKKAPWVGGKQLEAIRQGTYNEQAAMSDYIRDNVSGEGLANAGAEQIRQMVTFAAQNSRNGDNSYMHSLSRARADLENDPKRAGGLQNAVRREINNIPLPQNHGSGGGNNQNNQNNQNNRDQGGNDQGGNDNNQGDDN